jgi:hypothetical protein
MTSPKQPGQGVRTEWSAQYVQSIRAQGKFLVVTIGGVPAFDNPDALAVVGTNVVAVISGATTFKPITGEVFVQEKSNDAIELMAREALENGEGRIDLRRLDDI